LEYGLADGCFGSFACFGRVACFGSVACVRFTHGATHWLDLLNGLACDNCEAKRMIRMVKKIMEIRMDMELSGIPFHTAHHFNFFYVMQKSKKNDFCFSFLLYMFLFCFLIGLAMDDKDSTMNRTGF